MFATTTWQKVIIGSSVIPLFLSGLFIFSMWPPSLPPLEDDGYWGPGDKPETESEDLTRIYVRINQAAKDDLQRRVANSRYFKPLEGIGFQYGFNADYMTEVLQYWKTQYKWEDANAVLDKYEHFHTSIEGIQMHFIWAKSSRINETRPGRPLLLLHGWPSSVWEFHKVLPLLTNPCDENVEPFNVIIPSLPGYGFSTAAMKPGLNQRVTARIMYKLMRRLNYTQYYVHGNDWGSFVATYMAQLYPEDVRGLHITTFPVSNFYNSMTLVKSLVSTVFPKWFMTNEERERFQSFSHQFKRYLVEMGFMHLHGTRPDTLGFALTDSPIGLTAYMLEKYAVWTAPDAIGTRDGGIANSFSLSDLLTQVSIYWYNKNIVQPMRYYKEHFDDPAFGIYERHPVTVPTGLTSYPGDLTQTPYFLAKERFTNVVSYKLAPRGGHFAALEIPDAWVEDLLEFVANLDTQNL